MCERCEELELTLSRAAIERDELVEAIDFMRNRYSAVGGRGCSICLYENGVFKQRCKLHEEIDFLRTLTKLT